MAHLDFYATDDDLAEWLTFVFAETDLIAYEMYSAYDQEPRRFETAEALLSAPVQHLQLWSPTVMAQPIVRRIALNGPGDHFRYAVGGAGLVQLYRADPTRDGSLGHTHVGNWEEPGARRKEAAGVDAVDWPALRRLSGKVRRRIARRAAARLSACPVLPHAFAEVQTGRALLLSGRTFGADALTITPAARRG